MSRRTRAGHPKSCPFSPTGLSPSMVRLSRPIRLTATLITSVRSWTSGTWPPTTPTVQRIQAVTHRRFRLFPFRSPLLRELRLLSFPGGTKMFQFPPFASCPLCIHRQDSRPLRRLGCPIRESPDQRLFAPHRSLSQLITPFIAC